MRNWLIVAALALASCGLVQTPEQRRIAEAKEAVAAELRDPSSAQFREVVVGGDIICGEVNGKNAYGAYAGFTRFIYHGLRAEIQPLEPINPTVEDIDELNAFATFLHSYNECRSAAWGEGG